MKRIIVRQKFLATDITIQRKILGLWIWWESWTIKGYNRGGTVSLCIESLQYLNKIPDEFVIYK